MLASHVDIWDGLRQDQPPPLSALAVHRPSTPFEARKTCIYLQIHVYVVVPILLSYMYTKPFHLEKSVFTLVTNNRFIYCMLVSTQQKPARYANERCYELLRIINSVPRRFKRHDTQEGRKEQQRKI
jgi:hypothetical protein